MSSDPIVRHRTRRTVEGRPVSCLGCLGTVAATMALCTALVWALNPEMTVQDAAREGILWGGGVTALLMVLGCGVPVLLIVIAIVVATRRSRSQRSDADNGPTVIDV